jgi:hypothetical protein
LHRKAQPLAHSVGELANHGAIWWRKRPDCVTDNAEAPPQSNRLPKIYTHKKSVEKSLLDFIFIESRFFYNQIKRKS